MSSKSEYVPGTCNIGPAEIRMRKRAGVFGLAATLLLWALFAGLRVPAPWNLLLFLPAAVGASGFLQAALHFCAGFGSRGLFNFGSEVGKTESVEQAEFRKLDQRKAREIGLYSGLYSGLIGLLVAALGFFSRTMLS